MHIKNVLIRKYIILYIKYQLKITLIFSGLPLILTGIFLFVPSIEFHDALIFLAIPFMSVLYFLWSLLYLIGFQNMIKEQESRYGIVFDDTNAQKLDNTVFVSDAWLIFSGKYAFYYRDIQNITSIKYRHRRGYYYIVIHTVNKEKYTTSVSAASIIPKIKTWFQKHRNGEKQATPERNPL